MTVIRGIAGFAAGALAVAIFHQGMLFAMKQAGMPLQGMPWSLAPNNAAFGMPSLLNLMFWGGLWGVAFALLWQRVPVRPSWLSGLVFGVLGPMLLGSWIAVALMKGRPLFNGFLTDWKLVRLQTGFLLNGLAFGLGLGLLYPMLASWLGVKRDR